MKHYAKHQFGSFYENQNRLSRKDRVSEETTLSNNYKTTRKITPIIHANSESRHGVKGLIEAFQGKIILHNTEDYKAIMNMTVVYPLQLE